MAQTLLGVAPSRSEEWRQRKLAQKLAFIYLDGVYFKVRHGEGAVSMPFLVALGVGHKEVLALRASAEESKEGWQLLLEDLRRRGVQQVVLFLSDGSDGLLAALGEVFPHTPRQRCWVHIQRNVCSAIPKKGWRFVMVPGEVRKPHISGGLALKIGEGHGILLPQTALGIPGVIATQLSGFHPRKFSEE